jgi:hypothetical protein
MEFLDPVNEILFWLAAWALVWQTWILVFHKGVPNIRTVPALRKEVIETLRADMVERGKASNYTIIDLGAGDGHLSRTVARSIPEARVIGLEVFWLSYMIAKLLKLIYGVKNVEYKRTNFFKYDVAHADAVTMYLVAPLMQKVGEKLNKELKPGALVISNKFKLGDGWVPEEVRDVKTLYIHQKDLYIYRKA